MKPIHFHYFWSGLPFNGYKMIGKGAFHDYTAVCGIDTINPIPLRNFSQPVDTDLTLDERKRFSEEFLNGVRDL